MIRSFGDAQAPEPSLVVQEITDPAEIARCRAQDERHKRNSDWLQAHWGDLLPQARGKFVAVAGQEAYIAETATAAWDWASKYHPEDDGAFVRYVRTQPGLHIYALRW